MKTIAYALIDDIYLTVQGAERLADEDWDAYMMHRAQHVARIRKLLVISHGARPNSAQRTRIRKLLASGHQPKVAIVTPSQLARNTAGLLSWFLKEKLGVFLPHELDSAFAFLGASAAQVEQLRKAIAEFEAQLDLGAPGDNARP